MPSSVVLRMKFVDCLFVDKIVTVDQVWGLVEIENDA